jgi:hypothetical protein
MNETTWRVPAARLNTLYESGEDIPKAVSDLSPGRGTWVLPLAVFGTLAE